eukprot:jgi/Tetstr1/462695/TSEL_007661.t1
MAGGGRKKRVKRQYNFGKGAAAKPPQSAEGVESAAPEYASNEGDEGAPLPPLPVQAVARGEVQPVPAATDRENARLKATVASLHDALDVERSKNRKLGEKLKDLEAHSGRLVLQLGAEDSKWRKLYMSIYAETPPPAA